MTGDMFIGICAGITALLILTLYIVYKVESNDKL